MSDLWRTHRCGQVSKKEVGCRVILSGWVHRRRDHGGLIFIDLRDKYGIIQLVCDPKINAQMHSQAERVRSEWVLRITGQVVLRKEGMQNLRMASGQIEVEVSSLEVLSKACTPPFSICEEEEMLQEENRLKYRYLEMRRGKLLQNLYFRHRLTLFIRNFMDRREFVEVNTPILCRSTPEGARDYLVPSRIYPGHFYALPQSPQLFKQLLMIGNLDRYFQIAPCFRDEDLRADRQPEFTQLDFEMSFASTEELYSLVEDLFSAIFSDLLDLSLPLPFPRLSYAQCMQKYGTDKPDLRFDLSFIVLDDIVRRSECALLKRQLEKGGIARAICVPKGAELSRRELEKYAAFVSSFGLEGLSWMKVEERELRSPLAKFFSSSLQKELIDCTRAAAGDLLLLAVGKEEIICQAFDHLRRKIARDLGLISSKHHYFLWVIDFPLFSWSGQEERWKASHHPFTAPKREDIALLDSELEKVHSSSYDLVLNGYELGSGSQRIHNWQLQQRIFRALQLSEQQLQEKFGFFLKALQYGTPPHLGMALGMERLLMILLGTENIRDVVSFPKSHRGMDLMSQTPTSIEVEQLCELGLTINSRKEKGESK